MKLEDKFSDAMTVRDAIELTFNDDWNSQKLVAQSRDGDVFHAHIYLHADVPIALAREVLKDFHAKK